MCHAKLPRVDGCILTKLYYNTSEVHLRQCWKNIFTQQGLAGQPLDWGIVFAYSLIITFIVLHYHFKCRYLINQSLVTSQKHKEWNLSHTHTHTYANVHAFTHIHALTRSALAKAAVQMWVVHIHARCRGCQGCHGDVSSAVDASERFSLIHHPWQRSVLFSFISNSLSFSSFFKVCRVKVLVN